MGARLLNTMGGIGSMGRNKRVWGKGRGELGSTVDLGEAWGGTGQDE